jgi:hypothetical protein
MKAQTGSNLFARWRGRVGQCHPSAALPLENNVREAGWPPGPIWTDAENLAVPGFDSRTFQPVARRYTDYAVRAHIIIIIIIIIIISCRFSFFI